MSPSPPQAQSPTKSQIDAQRILEATLAEHYARLTANLIGACGGDFQLAEDALQDAVLAALERWPVDGHPRHADAWLLTTARRKAIDRLRREKTWQRKQEVLARLHAIDQETANAMPDPLDADSAIPDDRLRLIFTCCHPTLAGEAQVALTLRTIAGLETSEIARAFLVTPETMAKRLTRAKRKIRDAKIPYVVPPAHQLPDRLANVLAVLYLVFNEGYLASQGASLIRDDLCNEAIRLARLLSELMPDEEEALGLLALMILIDARKAARTDTLSDLVPLEEQDRTRWDQPRIAEGTTVIDQTLQRRRPGPYQLQAAIAALHAAADRPERTDWPQIALLYGELHRLQPTPIVELNRAAAVSMADGPEAGLQILDRLDATGSLRSYHLFHAARADMLRRAGRLKEAAPAYREAITLCVSAIEQRYLRRRLREVEPART